MPITGDAGAYVAAAAGLGTASAALVDSSKAFLGGISNRGFGFIEEIVGLFYPGGAAGAGEAWNGRESTLETLRANWINGTPLADQKAIAKSLIKLGLAPATAPAHAKAAGVDAAVLAAVAAKLAGGQPMTPQEDEVHGRYDFILTAMLDRGYQKADQAYRNTAKALSMGVAVVLAFFCGWSLSVDDTDLLSYAFSGDAGKSILVGILATPLAPVAKDLTSALAAGVKAVQAIRR